MSETPSIANVVAQVAISGTLGAGTAEAAEDKVIDDMVQLGVSREAVTRAVEKALNLKMVRRTSDDRLVVSAG